MIEIILIVLGSLLLLVAILIFIVDRMYRLFLYKRGDGDLRITYPSIPSDLDAEYITIKGTKKMNLHGFIYKAKNLKRAKNLIVISHGIGAGHIYLRPMIRRFCLDGYIVLAFDQYASGMSEGRRIEALSTSVYDLHQVLEYVSKDEELSKYDIYLFGHSLGGFASECTLNFKNDKIKKIVSISGFNSEQSFITSSMKYLKPIGWLFTLRNALYAGRYAFYSFGSGLRRNKTTSVYYLQGEKDTIVNPEDSKALLDKFQRNNLKAEFLPGHYHSPYNTIESEEKQNEVFKVFGMLGGGNAPSSLDINYEKYSIIDDEVYKKIIDFYNN